MTTARSISPAVLLAVGLAGSGCSTGLADDQPGNPDSTNADAAIMTDAGSIGDAQAANLDAAQADLCDPSLGETCVCDTDQPSECNPIVHPMNCCAPDAPFAAVTGRASWSDGRPMSGHTIQLCQAIFSPSSCEFFHYLCTEPGDPMATVDEQGEFRLDAVSTPGAPVQACHYTLVVRNGPYSGVPPTHGGTPFEVFTLEPDETRALDDIQCQVPAAGDFPEVCYFAQP